MTELHRSTRALVWGKKKKIEINMQFRILRPDTERLKRSIFFSFISANKTFQRLSPSLDVVSRFKLEAGAMKKKRGDDLNFNEPNAPSVSP